MIFYEDSHGVILYQSKDQPTSNEKQKVGLPSFQEVKKKFDKPVISQFFGLIIFLVSFIGLGLTVGPLLASEISFKLKQFKKEATRISQNKPAKPKRIFFADLLGKVEFEKIPQPIDANFGIVIPKIGVNVKVVANVDAQKPKEFLFALKQGVAHAAGTALPNEEGAVFIFGHSTDFSWNVSRYNAVFYQIKDLEIGDEINLFFNGRRYYYKMTEKRIVAAADTGFLKEPVIGRLLILQTCWPPGTIKERLLIFAKPIIVNSNLL